MCDSHLTTYTVIIVILILRPFTTVFYRLLV